MAYGAFDYERLVALLTELAERITAASPEPCEIRVVGGAAISLKYNHQRDPTGDVDALQATNADVVYAAASAVAVSHGLRDNWLNFKVKMYAPDPMYSEPDWSVVLEHSNVRILVPEPRMLLAMKLRAGRGRDLGDVDVLLHACDISTYANAVAAFREFYTDDEIKPLADAYLRDRLT